MINFYVIISILFIAIEYRYQKHLKCSSSLIQLPEMNPHFPSSLHFIWWLPSVMVGALSSCMHWSFIIVFTDCSVFLASFYAAKALSSMPLLDFFPGGTPTIFLQKVPSRAIGCLFHLLNCPFHLPVRLVTIWDLMVERS